MRLNGAFLITLVLVLVSTFSHAQNWTGLLSPSRAIDWSQAGAGAIPTTRANCVTSQCNTLFGGTVTAASINAAIVSAPANTVVRIPAGSFTISGQITFDNHSNVTLRGAGPDRTSLVFSGSSGCTGLGANICVKNGDTNDLDNPSNTASWSGPYSVGTNSITLSSATNLQVGTMLILDQLDDTSVPAADAYVCQTASCTAEGGISGRSGRGQHQQVKVTSIAGTGPYTIGITPAIYLPNWRSGATPQAWWSNSLPIVGIGIEDLTLDHRAHAEDAWAGGGIFYHNAYGGWVKNVRSLNTNIHKHIWYYQSAKMTVRDSYFMGSHGTSESYGVDCAYSSSDILVENNIFQHIASAVISEGCTGMVGAYNYNLDDYYINDTSWQQAGEYHHSIGDAFTLWEGNVGVGMTNDAVHGTSNFFTVFRNYWSGRDIAGGSSGGKTAQTSPILMYASSRFFNLVGNVFGTSGYHTGYQCAAATTSDSCASAGERAIYGLGYSGHYGHSTFNNDPFTVTSLMRWGNYDTVNAGVRWASGEVPSGLARYANAVPTTQVLPDSFYLSARPGWWGNTIPWPPIGPDVSGGNIANVGGHANLNPAANCYLNVMRGSPTGGSTPYTFNAASCYTADTGGGTTPAPPTSLTVVVN